ncbi:MAG: hypothetical protein P0Y62_02475 [Candidatus Chryseobacterium colombiense]|nr:hypothetical protein [Chryseobacterium sp.]WEK70420.1 MAG: hypothetical protein P0Y62_02475 [Chryseobacterium sp.]
MKKNKATLVSMAGIVLLVISILILKDLLKWIGFAGSLLCFITALSLRLSKD